MSERIYDIDGKAKEYFLARIQKCDSGCWHWTKERSKDGYGVAYRPGVTIRAHRLSYLIYKGNIPTGMLVCHTCDNRLCVNPEHLFLGTPKDNTQDMVSKRRNRIGSDHKMSKLKTEDVIYIRSSGLQTAVLAKQFNVHSDTIRRARNAKKWSHVSCDIVSAPVGAGSRGGKCGR